MRPEIDPKWWDQQERCVECGVPDGVVYMHPDLHRYFEDTERMFNALVGIERQVTAVLALHTRRVGTAGPPAERATYDYCVECRQAWPCETVQAITEAK